MDFSIEVYSVNGKKISTEHFKNTSYAMLDLSNHSKGVYFVKISTDKKEHVCKVIKK